MTKKIASAQNPYIKHLIRLRDKSRLRKSTGQFIIEGFREIQLALLSGYEVVNVLKVPKNRLNNQDFLSGISADCFIEITPALYKKIALRNSEEGFVAILKSKSITFEKIKFNKPNPLLLVTQSLEKPGNIGALLRTADALGVDAVLIADTQTDLYNPHLIRNSLGAVFTLPVVCSDSFTILNFLKEQQYHIYTAVLHCESKNYALCDFNQATAIVVGSEAYGLSDAWLNCPTSQKIVIPMYGQVDSMNVSVSAAILLSEARRQRSR